MSKFIFSLLAVAALCASAHAQITTDLTRRQTEDARELREILESNFTSIESRVAAVEAGTLSSTLSVAGATTLSGSVTVIGTSVTSRWDNAASKIDGEHIADDTIDDDSIDWADVTSTDITFDAGTVGEAAIVQTAWAQSDTNAITLINTYTPQHVGDILIGYLNSSNWVWVARGTTTNDWQQIAP